MSGDCEWTLAMIKPDAVRAGKAEEIKQLILLSGFTIIAEQKIQVRDHGCEGNVCSGTRVTTGDQCPRPNEMDACSHPAAKAMQEGFCSGHKHLLRVHV